MSMYLHVDQGSWKDTEACTVKYSISIPKIVIYWEPGIWTFRKGVDRGHGCSVSLRSQDVLTKGCIDDTLSIIVEIHLLHEARPRFWTPRTNFNRERLKAFKNEIMADVTFLVGSKNTHSDNGNGNGKTNDNEGSSKDEAARQKQSYQEEIKANSTILLLAAPFMKDLLESGMSDSASQTIASYSPFKSKRTSSNVIPLPNVNPSHFRFILRFIYADDTSFIDNQVSQTHLQEILKTANQFGCWRLKLVIEHRLIQNHLVYGNCVEMLLFAHVHYCAMLKEAAIKMVCQYWSSLLHRSNFLQLCQCTDLLKEIHEYSTGETMKDTKEDEFSKMSVGELYEWLEHDDDVYLECDMSRPMLLSLIRATMEAREKKFEQIT
uniref:BTB domain-containing protein n=1 Tax=Craspedostauros australis TaxID=1486917 RepID=A0A7R9ZMW5_9STRA